MVTIRKNPIIVGQIYHVFNRSIGRQPIFLNNSSYQRALETINYYQYLETSLRFSHFNRLPANLKNRALDVLLQGRKRVKILAYCLMPNHFHFLIQEISDRGISNFMSNLQNSYAKFFNTKNERNGALFQQMFKAVLIESDEQLIHVTRYIHLNPLTSFILKDIKELSDYLWSSFQEYLGRGNLSIVDKEFILDFFPSIQSFIDFTKDQIDYQRQLDKIQHLLLE